MQQQFSEAASYTDPTITAIYSTAAKKKNKKNNIKVYLLIGIQNKGSHHHL